MPNNKHIDKIYQIKYMTEEEVIKYLISISQKK